MRLLARILVLTLSFLLGLAAGTVGVLLHRSLPGMVLGVGTALVVLWTLRLWLPHATLAFAAGWLAALVVAMAGRGEGDYVVSSDALGWLLIGSGFMILVTAITLGRAPTVRSDSGSVGEST